MNESEAIPEPPRTADSGDVGFRDETEFRRETVIVERTPFFPRRFQTVRALAVGIAALLLMVGALAAWWFRAERRMGWIELTTNGAALVAQVLPEAGDAPLGDPFPVMARVTLALPAGDYQLRVHGVGRLGRDLSFRREPRRDTIARTLARRRPFVGR